MDPQPDQKLQSILKDLTKRLEGSERDKAIRDISHIAETDPDGDIAENLLNAVNAGSELWEWGVDYFEAPGTLAGYGYSYGWCAIDNGRVVASFCHSFS